MLVELLEKLITKKYYATKEEIENKLNIFFAMNKITDEEYSNLTLKAEEFYAPVVETEENTEAIEQDIAEGEE